MLEEDSGSPILHRPQCSRVAHSGRDHENLAGKPESLRGGQESCSRLVSQIVVEQHQVYPFLPEQL